MSSFRDTFSKEEKKDNLLDYDDSAFLFFLGTILACVLVPWTWSLLSTFFSSGRKEKCNVKYCQCSFCVNRVESVKREESSWEKRLTWSFFAQLLVIVVLWVFTIHIGGMCSRTKAIQTFDPFEILEIPLSATDKQIKKQYRVMSLKFHPDKNPNDPTAGAKFVMISKAYQALTDEVSKRNYEKFGNPDGPSAMKVGIGLPRFLVEEGNQLFFLILFFTILLIIIPLIFLCYYRRLQRYAQNGVEVETLQFLSYVMSEGTRVRNCPELLAASAESRELKIRPSDNADMQRLMREVVEPRKRQFKAPVIVRNYFLIIGHMQRLHHLMTPELVNDVNQLLKKAVLIIPTMMEIALLSNWFLTAQSVLEFQRSLCNCLGFRNSSLLQIPHVTDETLKQANKGGKTRQLQEVLRHRSEDSKTFGKMNQLQLADMGAFCAHVSDLDVTADVFVDDEKEIAVGDIVTIKVKMERTNLQEGETMGPVHAPNFPVPKFEEWWICATTGDDSANLLGFTRVRSQAKTVDERIQFPARRAGKHEVTVHFLCDSYSGIDKTITVSYRVFTENEVKREVFVHPEDEALDDEPSYLQKVMGQVADDSSDEGDGAEDQDDSDSSEES